MPNNYDQAYNQQLPNQPKYKQTELFLNLDIYEGPLDLLLELVKTHKIDITNLPLVELVDQYLAFLKQVDKYDIAISADYLAMAAYLVWLKSLKLIPQEDPEQLGQIDFSQKLKRYAALKEAAAKMMELPSLGREFWNTEAQELVIKETPFAEADLFALLNAKTQMDTRKDLLRIPSPLPVYMQEDAMEHLADVLSNIDSGKSMSLEKIFPPQFKNNKDVRYKRSVVAAVFCAALEMTRIGKITMTPAKPMPLIKKMNPKITPSNTPPIAPNV